MSSDHATVWREDFARSERRRLAAVNVVAGCYRLARSCQLFDDGNQTVQQLIQPLVESVGEYCGLFGVDQVTLLFHHDIVFVNRRMLRASRDSYALGVHFGTYLAHCELNELTLERVATGAALLRVMRLIADAQRDRNASARLAAGGIPGVALRKAPDLDLESSRDRDESPVARLVKNYAAAILILKSVYAQLARGETGSGHLIKRIAQKLVALSEEQIELLVATAAGTLVDDDRARRAVSTAVVALAMARVITQDRSTLTTLALAALFADAGALRLGDQPAADRVAASAHVVLTVMGRLYPTSIRRTVVACEALEMSSPVSSVYGGSQPPTLLASLLFVARRFNELRTPTAAVRRKTIDDAIRVLESEAAQSFEKVLVRLLVSGLGFYPTSTIVQLSTGEVAVVSGVPSMALDFPRPPVQIFTDARQQMLAKPIPVNLARQPPGQPPRTIVRPLLLEERSLHG